MSIRSFLISSILLTFVYTLPVHAQIAQRLDVIVKKVKVSIKIMLPKRYSWISARPDIIFPISIILTFKLNRDKLQYFPDKGKP